MRIREGDTEATPESPGASATNGLGVRSGGGRQGRRGKGIDFMLQRDEEMAPVSLHNSGRENQCLLVAVPPPMPLDSSTARRFHLAAVRRTEPTPDRRSPLSGAMYDCGSPRHEGVRLCDA